MICSSFILVGLEYLDVLYSCSVCFSFVVGVNFVRREGGDEGSCMILSLGFFGFEISEVFADLEACI